MPRFNTFSVRKFNISTEPNKCNCKAKITDRMYKNRGASRENNRTQRAAAPATEAGGARTSKQTSERRRAPNARSRSPKQRERSGGRRPRAAREKASTESAGKRERARRERARGRGNGREESGGIRGGVQPQIYICKAVLLRLFHNSRNHVIYSALHMF